MFSCRAVSAEKRQPGAFVGNNKFQLLYFVNSLIFHNVCCIPNKTQETVTKINNLIIAACVSPH